MRERASALLDKLFPERTLGEDRALIEQEQRAQFAERARWWGPVLLVLQAIVIVGWISLSVSSPTQLLWRRNVIALWSFGELCDVPIVLAAFWPHGSLRWIARNAGELMQTVALVVFAGLGLNAQLVHGSVALYCALLVAAPFAFPARSSHFAVLSTLTTSALIAGQFWLQPTPILRWNNISLAFGSTVFGIAVGRLYVLARVREFVARRALEEQRQTLAARVEEKTHELRALAARLEERLESERRRIAADLHDELGQDLTALQLEVAALEAVSSDSKAKLAPRLARMSGSLERARGAVHAILESLRPRILDEEGLEAAVLWLARSFEERAGVPCRTTITLFDEPDPLLATVIFRVVQEGLTNIARHGSPKLVDVSVITEGDELHVVVRNVGQPVATPARAGHGLSGMLDRVRAVGGELRVTLDAVEGATVFARLPLQATPPAA